MRAASRNAPRRTWRDRSIPLALAALSFAVALLQRPGANTFDTKVDLHVDPVGFLGDVAAVWTNTGSLGEVQGGQYAGYLFPMGPFFALGDLLGLEPWLVHRLWLGLLLALAAWGIVRLLDALLGTQRGAAHVVAGLLYAFNPYTVVYAQRTSVTLLGLAVLPWLLLATYRGLSESRRWLWPAAFALLVTASGAAVNAAVTAWVLVGPLALAAYELAVRNATWRQVGSLAWRTALLSALASAWWLVPVLEQALYGIDFLQFTEQPGAIWSTTSITESLRLMGYWPSYLGVGFGRLEPFYESSPTLLFDAAVVAATLLVPALAIAGLAVARRLAYGPFFLALVLLGVLVMAAGFPPGTPLRQGVTFAYNHLETIQFLRTTHKAGPLVALGLACLGGIGVAAVLRAVPRRAGWGLVALGAVLVAVSVWPLTRGTAVDSRLTWDAIPAPWKQAASDLDRDLPRSSRALVLPGQLLASYEWGVTVDPILPALTDRPVALRQFVPRADLHGVDLLWTVDQLVQQERLVPGQLRPLLGLLGVGAVVSGADDLARRGGAVPPTDAARMLAGQGLQEKERYGPRRRRPALDGDYAARPPLPAVRRYDTDPERRLVRVQPARRPLLVDGSAAALTGLAAFGALPRDQTIEYAGDREHGELRPLLRAGGEVVVSDSNRRRVYVTASLRQSTGPTLAAGEEISEDAARLDPFPERGDEARTVAVHDGAEHLRAPYSPGFPQYPEHRPLAAFDGSTETEWLADSHLDVDRRWIEIGFERPRDVPAIELLPAGGQDTAVVAVEIDGRSYDVRPGWNRLRLGLRDVDRLRVLVESTPKRQDLSAGNGIAELRVPGVRVRESLRPPTLAESALRGADLARTGWSYLFERTTGDRPLRRDGGRRPVRKALPGKTEDPERERIRDAVDPETEIARVFRPPAERTYSVDAWASVSPEAADEAIDRLTRTRTDARLRSSGRFQGLARHRASAAFDGTPRAWIADRAGPSTPWIEWERPSATRLARLRIQAAPAPAGRPTVVRVRGDGRASGPLDVGADGVVVLDRPLAARRFRVEILEIDRPGGDRGETAPTVGIAEIEGPGLPRATPRRGGRLDTGCGAAAVTVTGGGETNRAPLRLVGSIADVEAGRPVRAVGCRRLQLSADRQRLRTRAGRVRVDYLMLRSPAPRPPAASRSGGAVLDSGDESRGRYDGVRVRVDGPAWLVLGESYNRGWRAACDGRDLGEPRVVDGYANGWRAPRDCRDVTFDFRPQRFATAGYGLSAVVCAALLLLLVGGLRRSVPPAGPHAPPPDLPEPAAERWPASRAIAAAAVATVAIGFLFALRAGVVLGPLVGLVLWRGVGVRVLVACAVALLGVVVPLIYLLFPAEDAGGYNSGYAQALVEAHWAGVAAFVLLALALWRSLSTARARRGAPAPAPVDAGPPPAQP